MRRVRILVEGQTEHSFLRGLLTEAFLHRQLALSVPILGGPGHKGGVVKLDRVVGHVSRLLREDRACMVTTFFDYYRLEGTGPAGRTSAALAADHFEQQLAARVRAQFDDSFDQTRFVPYVQLHELEALFFAHPEVVARVMNQPEAVASLRQVVAEYASCEAIDDGPDTHPAARFSKIFPAYRKGGSDRAHAPVLALHLQLGELRLRCPRFNQWLERWLPTTV